MRLKHLKAATPSSHSFCSLYSDYCFGSNQISTYQGASQNKTWGRTMAKMVGICLASPLGGGPNLNTILLDPLQNVSTLHGKKASSAAKRPASSLTRARRLDPSHRSSLHKQSLYGQRSPPAHTIHRPHRNGIQKQKVKMPSNGEVRG